MQDRLKADVNNAFVKAMTPVAEVSYARRSITERVLLSLRKASPQSIHREDSYILLESLQRADRQDVYENVRETALSLEGTRKRASEMNQERSFARNERHRTRENMLSHKEMSDVKRT